VPRRIGGLRLGDSNGDPLAGLERLAKLAHVNGGAIRVMSETSHVEGELLLEAVADGFARGGIARRPTNPARNYRCNA
jgi:hypothetical protein